MQARTPRSARKNSGSSSMVAAFGLLLVVGGMVVLGIMIGKRAEPAVEPEPEAGPVDPFANMNYTDAPTRKTGGGISGPEFESSAETWLRAKEVYAEANAKLLESNQLRLDGDPGWRTVGALAKDLYEEAVQRAEVYREVLEAEVGDSSPSYKSFERTLQTWRREMMGLRKTVGQ